MKLLWPLGETVGRF